MYTYIPMSPSQLVSLRHSAVLGAQCRSLVGCSELTVACLALGKWASMPPSLLPSSFLLQWLLCSCSHHASSGWLMSAVGVTLSIWLFIVSSALDAF